MKKTDYTDACWKEAGQKLDAYLATGLAGFLDQAWDRLRAIGINLSALAKDRASALHLREHVRLFGNC